MRAEVLAIQQLASFRLSKTVKQNLAPQVVGSSGFFGTGVGADLLAESRELDSEIQALDAELSRKVNLGNNKDPQWIWYSSQWLGFKNQWETFYSDQGRSGFIIAQLFSPFLQKKIWDDIQEYRERFNVMYNTAKNIGIDVKSAPPTAPKQNLITESIDEAKKAVTSIWNDVLKPVLIILAIALGLGFVVFQLGR